MNILATVSLISCVVCLALGTIVLYSNKKANLNRLFFLLILAGFVYAFTTIMMWRAPDPENALIWNKLGTMWPLFVALTINFALVFTNNRWIKNPIHYIVLYVPAVIFWLTDLGTNLINTSPVLEYWGFNDQPSGTLVYDLSTVWSAALPLLAFALCFMHYRNAKTPSQRKQRKYVTIGFCIPIVAFVATNMMARTLDLPIPNLGIIGTSFFSIFVGYAIVKYELFNIDAGLAAENILTTMPDSLVLTDIEAKMLRVNERLTSFTGYSDKELLGDPITKLAAASDPAWVTALQEVSNKKTIRNHELILQTKTQEKRHVLFSASVVESKTNHPIGLACIIRDITERKKAEEELADTKNYLETLLNSMMSAIVVIDARSHEIVDVNAAGLKMIGGTRNEIISKTCHKFICPAQDGKCPITDLGLTVDNQERTLITKEGKNIPILKSVVKLELKDRLLLIENFVDLSERKNMEKKLLKTERLESIGELARQVGHDLRNPLAGIKNGLYLLKKKGNQIPEQKREELLDTMSQAVEDSNRIITSLVEYSDELILQPEQCTPQALVLRAISKVQVPSRITIINQATDDDKIFLDDQRIENVFACLIRNAIDAIAEEGTVQIRSRIVRSNIEFSFSDSGTGIPKDILPKLFSPLVTSKAKGMGMNLAICKRIVEAHGGKIAVDTSLMKGAIFTITLPIRRSKTQFSLANPLFELSPNFLAFPEQGNKA
jgi:PAS domain S-box-containing protein